MTSIMNTYGRLDASFNHGEGCWLVDNHGERYLDALSGIAVCGLGHAHPAVSKAISEQADLVIHTSNLYGISRQQQLADLLTNISGMDNVFFSNSGAEANEAAIKIARRYGHSKDIHEPAIIVMDKAFHGRTMATLTATGNVAAQRGFGPLLSGFIRVPYMKACVLRQVIKANPNVVAVMLEPVQGEGGLATADSQYLTSVRSICDEHNLLMMVDEIQTGNGRTGSYFCFQQFNFLPDVLTTAKGLGNGVPIGACLARGEAAHMLQPGSHGSTYGGNPLACAAGVAVVETIMKEKWAEHAAELGDYIRQQFEQRLRSTEKLIEIRGRGLMIGLVMNQDCPQLMAKGIEHRILLNVTSGNVIRLLPPLIMSKDEADLMVDRVCDLVATLD